MNKILPIRSYVRRQGRMMPAQKIALDELWAYYGITKQGPLDLDSLYGRQAPRYLEIGFGMGDALLEMADSHPENDYIGVEVHLPGIGKLLQGLQEKEITNVRIDRRDAHEVLGLLPEQSMAGIYLFFPDPWEKRRHHKRRLVQSAFVAMLRRVLAPGGFFHVVTDWDDYVQHIVGIMEAANGFRNRAGSSKFHSRPMERTSTRFEQRAIQKGHTIRDLIYDRI